MVLPARRATLIFIFVTVLLDVLAFGLIIPGFPHLIAGFYGGDIAVATVWHGTLMTVFMATQFISSPIQGALSDHFGRRPIILLSNLGLAADFALMALANSFPVLIIGRILSGVTSASFSTANAYIADVTPPEKRAQSFGMLGVAFGIGFVIAPAIGGFLSEIHPRLPFWFAAGLGLVNFCYGLFVLPESLPVEKRAAFDWRRANPVGSLQLLTRYPQVFALAIVLFLMQLAHLVYPSTFVLYADYRFGWGEKMVGYTLAGVGILAAIVQGGLVKKIIAWLGERRAMLFGLMCGTMGFFLYGLAPNGISFWAVAPIAALWGVAGPAAQAIITREVDPHEQGRLQGAISSLTSVAGLFAPILFTQVFASVSHQTPSIWSGATFFLASAMVGAGLVIACFKTQHYSPAVQMEASTSETTIITQEG